MTSISESLKASEQDLLSKGEEEAQKVLTERNVPRCNGVRRVAERNVPRCNGVRRVATRCAALQRGAPRCNGVRRVAACPDALPLCQVLARQRGLEQRLNELKAIQVNYHSPPMVYCVAAWCCGATRCVAGKLRRRRVLLRRKVARRRRPTQPVGTLRHTAKSSVRIPVGRPVDSPCNVAQLSLILRSGAQWGAELSGASIALFCWGFGSVP
jgi:hypothetical protein